MTRITADEMVAFLAKLREDAIAQAKAHRDGPEGKFRQDVRDLINNDLRSSRARQKREQENRWKRRKPTDRPIYVCPADPENRAAATAVLV